MTKLTVTKTKDIYRLSGVVINSNFILAVSRQRAFDFQTLSSLSKNRLIYYAAPPSSYSTAFNPFDSENANQSRTST